MTGPRNVGQQVAALLASGVGRAIGAALSAAANGVAPGELRIWTASGHDDLALLCLLGDNRPRVVRGYGGRGTISRDGRRAVSTLAGMDTFAMQIDVLLENSRVPTPGGVKRKVKHLERLAGWGSGDDGPPMVQWAANCEHDALDAPGLVWSIEALDWGDDVSDDQGRLLWRKGTVTVGVQNGAEIQVQAFRGFRSETLHKGHDLRDFARRWLKDPKRWRDVADLNRDNPRCPSGAHAKAHRDVVLLVPERAGGSSSGGSGAAGVGRVVGGTVRHS